MSNRFTRVSSPSCSKAIKFFYKLRRRQLVNTLQEHFCEEEGCEVNREAVLEILQLDESQKALATNAMFEALPKCLVSCKGSGKGRVSVYKNVARKKAFTLLLDEPSLSLEENTEISNLKELIASVSAELESVVQHLDQQLSAA